MTKLVIPSVVKNSELTQVIHNIFFFFFYMLSIFNAVNAGVGLGKKCIYLVAEHLYVHIKQETFYMRAPTSHQRHASQTSTEKPTVLVTHALQLHTQRCQHVL